MQFDAVAPSDGLAFVQPGVGSTQVFGVRGTACPD
jgi:hypothetical protein